MKKASRVTGSWVLRQATPFGCKLTLGTTGCQWGCDSEPTETDIDTHSMANHDTLQFLSLDQIKSVRLPLIRYLGPII